MRGLAVRTRLAVLRLLTRPCCPCRAIFAAEQIFKTSNPSSLQALQLAPLSLAATASRLLLLLSPSRIGCFQFLQTGSLGVHLTIENKQNVAA